MSYYPKGHHQSDDVPEFDEYDETPYGGGYDISLTYGRPLPPSEETCYPPTSSSASDDFDYDRPHYTSSAEPSAYGDEALYNEYQNYSKPKTRPSRSRPSRDGDEDENPRRKPGMNRPGGGGGYGGESEYGESRNESDESGYGRKGKYNDESSEYGSGYGRKTDSDEYGSRQRRKSENEEESSEYGSGYGRRKTDSDEYGSGYHKKVSTRRKAQNMGLVMDERPTRMIMNLVDMGVNLHPVMDQGTEETAMMRRKTQNASQVMGERQTLVSMDQVDMERRQTMERKRTVGMEGNQQVMGVQTTRQQRVKGTGHHLRGLVMDSLRKRTTENPAMGGVMMVMKAMVARNMVMMTLTRTRRRNNGIGIATIAKTLTIEQSASITSIFEEDAAEEDTLLKQQR